MKTSIYNISGMSCAACSASVNRVVSRLDGVITCDVNLMTGKMTVSFDEKKVSDADFFRVVEKAGFGITPEEEKPKKTEEKNQIYPIVFSFISTAVLLFVSMGTMIFKGLKIDLNGLKNVTNLNNIIVN